MENDEIIEIPDFFKIKTSTVNNYPPGYDPELFD